MFDVFYMGNNQELTDRFPLAKRINQLEEINTKTKMYWLIEPNVELLDYDILKFRPETHDQKYTHVWKRDSDSYGGVKLIPNTEPEGTKQVNQVVCRRSFDILYEQEPGDYFDKNPLASYVWCIDPEYKLSDEIDWAPGDHEPNFIHTFHLRGQLAHKYPAEEGGVKLYPKAWQDAKFKYHGNLDAGMRYPVMYVQDPEQYSQRDIYQEDFVWLIDREYQINPDSLDYVPNPFEYNVIHSFRMPNQLKDKTWSFTHFEEDNELGGIRLVPKNWKDAFNIVEGGVIKHRHCPIQDKVYDMFFTNKAFDSDTFKHFAQRSQTEWFWVVDREYEFNGNLIYIPEQHESEYIHAFKWGLPNKYPEDITALWDKRAAGIWLVNKNFDITMQKLHTEVNPVKYDIFYVDDMMDYQRYARLSRTDAFWMIDAEHVMDDDFSWIPSSSDQAYINIFKVPGQLLDKYPTDVTDTANSACGGAKLVPVKYSTIAQDIKYQGYLAPQSFANWDTFESLEQGIANTTTDWFWVIDKNITVIEGFSFNFVPAEHDDNKIHVWQKLNPVTNRQYDYGGITLYPRVPPKRGRPKYVMEPASVQKPFEVCELSGDLDIIKQLEKYDADCDNSMFWAIDPFVRVSKDFTYDYYPSQWDENNVHVFLSGSLNGVHGGVRLYPKGTFAHGHKHTEESIQNNGFENLKLMNTVASEHSSWPLMRLKDMTRQEMVDIISTARKDGVPYVWTLDDDVDLIDGIVQNSFMPEVQNINKVHLWQRMSPSGESVHSYGGLRLWPTNIDIELITTDAVLTNKIKDLQYVKEPGSRYQPYDLVLITYHDDDAEEKYNKILERHSNAKWVKDVDGIFNAHQEAAKLCTSKLFWVVDADAEVADNFSFSYIPDQYDHDTVHVWKSMNPVTGDVYGYGGVKLFNRQQVLDATSWGLDFTTGLSKRFKVVDEVSCITRFNTSEYSAWRSAFRECVKLSRNNDEESDFRIENWLSPAFDDEEFADFAIEGAEAGIAFYEENVNNPTMLEKINDYEWLYEQFKSST